MTLQKMIWDAYLEKKIGYFLESKLSPLSLYLKEALQKALQLPIGKIVALRFASDSELPELLEKTLKGDFANSKEIKLAIKNWRGDYLRA